MFLCFGTSPYGCWQRRRAEAERRRREEDRKHEAGALLLQLSPSQPKLSHLPQAVSNVRKVLKKLRRETWKLKTHRNLTETWRV